MLSAMEKSKVGNVARECVGSWVGVNGEKSLPHSKLLKNSKLGGLLYTFYELIVFQIIVFNRNVYHSLSGLDPVDLLIFLFSSNLSQKTKNLRCNVNLEQINYLSNSIE